MESLNENQISDCMMAMILSRGRDFSFCHYVETSSGAYLAFCPVGTEVKLLAYEADHLPSSSAKVNDEWSCTTTVPYIFVVWC
jgi:hypothetical protein